MRDCREYARQPVIGIQGFLLDHGAPHEHVIANQVRSLKIKPSGIHRFEYQLRFITPLIQGDGHDFKALQTVPHHVRVVDGRDQRTE